MKNISQIQIEFDAPVELTGEFQAMLDALLGQVCRKYKEDHPGRIMWVFGSGSKPIWNEPHEPTYEAGARDARKRAGRKARRKHK